MFKNIMITKEEAREALLVACNIVKNNLPLYTTQCQNHSSIHNIYPACPNNQWTCGFWTGEIWLAFEMTHDVLFKEVALKQVDSFLYRIENKIEVDHHDMGFLYTPSCVAAYKLTGSEKAKKAAIKAAEQLISRFQPVGQFIQAWGNKKDKNNYRYIIDCLLNLPLLYWATEETKDKKYADIADAHIKTCIKYSIRQDGSTYHTFFMDILTGEPVKGVTCQGYADDSSWARGQAWAIYGIAISYAYTKKENYKELFKKVLDYYLKRLPDDGIPYWDMIFTQGEEEPRDSSSASIVACGLLEMSKYEEAAQADYYKRIASEILKSLTTNYAVKKEEYKPGIGIVKHGTYSKKSLYNTCTEEGVDECVSWGDYFYMEALTRYLKNWKMYW